MSADQNSAQSMGKICEEYFRRICLRASRDGRRALQIVSRLHSGNDLSWEFHSNAFGCLELNYFFSYVERLVCQRTDLPGVMQPVRKVRPGHDEELAGHRWLDKKHLRFFETEFGEKRHTMVSSAKKFSKELTVMNELGIHARSAAQIAALAQKARSGVWIVKDGESVDAASIIDILTLACDQGSRVTLRIQNSEDIEIFNDIVSLFENGFGE